jgi:hypothetical protein
MSTLNQLKIRQILFLTGLFCLLLSHTVSAQTTDTKQNDTSYEVWLHILVASNETGKKDEVPSALSNTVKKLKNNFSYSSYRLATTLMQRAKERSNFSYRAFMNGLNPENETVEFPTTFKWDFTGFAPNGDGIQLDNLRFSWGIPFSTKVVSVNESQGRASTRYESLDLNLGKVNLNENTPSVVGTITTPRPDEMLFVVLTIKAEK